MRISFVGKGGSGKTTLSSLFIRHLKHNNLPTLAIDADINQHLCDAVGVESGKAKALGLHQKDLKVLFAGSNPLIDPSKMIKTTPPGKGSFVAKGVSEMVNALSEFIESEDHLHFANVGSQVEDDVGIRCYHSKTGSVELILNHLVENTGEYIVVDMTAGADAFASGLFDKFDLTVVVVEPTKKSVSVFEQYASQAKKLGVNVRAVGNKILNEDDIAFLKEQLGDDLIGTMTSSAFVRAQERGTVLSFEELEPENKALLTRIQDTLGEATKDWKRYFDRSVDIHRKNAQSWANSSMGTDLESQIDTSFSYTD